MQVKYSLFAVIVVGWFAQPCLAQHSQGQHLCGGFVLQREAVVFLDIIGGGQAEEVEIVALDPRLRETIGVALLGRYRHPGLKRWQYIRLDRFTVGGEGAEAFLESNLPRVPAVSVARIGFQLFAVTGDGQLVDGDPAGAPYLGVLARLRSRSESTNIFVEPDLLIQRQEGSRPDRTWALSPIRDPASCVDCSHKYYECLCRIRNPAVNKGEALREIRLAVLDTGLLGQSSVGQGGFPSVAWKSGANTYDPINVVNCTSSPCSDVFDDKDHGTNVASTAAGEGTGVAPGATIIPVRIWQDDCTWTEGIAKGIEHAKREGANIIAMPWLLDVATEVVRIALKGASDSLLVVPSGDGGSPVEIDDYLIYPPRWKSDLPHMIVVGGLDRVDEWYSFYSRSLVDLATPSELCWARSADGNEYTYSGTSLGVGYVAGAAARVWAAQEKRGETPTPMTVKREIVETVRSLAWLSSCCDNGVCGSLDVTRALGGPATCVAPSTPTGTYCR